MANICTTEIKLILSEENANKMKSLLMDEGQLHFDKDVWVGDIYKVFGIEPNKDTHIRGRWQGVEIGNYGDYVLLTIIEESAWNPTKLALQLKEKGVVERFVFYAEECGNGLFYSNDEDGVFFDFRWYVYLSYKGEQEYFKELNDVFEYIYENTGNKFETVDEANEDEGVYIQPIEIVDDSEL